jgi:flagella basal body P-ring formation protein FlgA
MNHIRHYLAFVCLLSLCDIGRAAEVRLKSQARCASGIVRLSDLADIHAAEAWQTEQLSKIEFGPAPATGTKRFIRAREVQDALFMRGLNLAEHRISGSDRIEVQGPGQPAPETKPAKPTFRVDEAARDRAEQLVVAAVIRCLQKQAGGREPWEVHVELDEEQIASLVSSSRRVTAEGGSHPWTGSQRFSLRLDGSGEPIRFEVTAEVTLPPAVVAVARDIAPGTILHAADLTLKPVKALPQGLQPFYRIEEVVGQESTWGIPAGTLLGRTSIRRPVIVRRGDAVTLYARAAGLQVRTTVRAREDGAIGSLITVESLATREPFYARVTGIQEAEVYAAPAEAAAPAAAEAKVVSGTLGGAK